MSQPNGKAEFLRTAERYLRAPGFSAQAEPSPIERAQEDMQKAMQNYRDLEHRCAELQQNIIDIRVENGALVAEVNMLRDALKDSEYHRVRLQAVASTLSGQLLAINSIITEATQAALRNGIEASQKHEEDLEQAGAEAAEVLQRVEPAVGFGGPAAPGAPPPAPQAAGAPLEQVDWSRVPQS